MANKVVFKPILPKNPHYFEDLERELTSGLASSMTGPVAKTLKAAEEDYIDNWDHKPDIVAQFKHQKTQLKLTVTPFGRNKKYWVFVSRGADGKVYGPKSAQYLQVREDYIPKTAPAGIYGGPGSYSGNVYYAEAVSWPGIEPRHFEEHIIDKYTDTVIQYMFTAVRNVLRRY